MVNNAYTESVRNKTPYDIVHRLLMKDGRVKYVNEKCETYYDVEGKPLRSTGTVHDITERHMAELELAQLSLQNRLILDSAGEGIYGLDVDGRCTFVNPAALKLIGFTAEELIGRTVMPCSIIPNRMAVAIRRRNVPCRRRTNRAWFIVAATFTGARMELAFLLNS